MKQYDRISQILAYLEEHDRITVKEICGMFHVSKDTARRDIVQLEKTGVVERYRGGVHRPMLRQQVEQYKTRLVSNSEVKRFLAKKAARMVKDGDVVMLDLSTTIQFVAEYLADKEILAVTHSIDNALTLMKTGAGRIHLTGGYYYRESHALMGACVAEKIADFHFDFAFIGAAAIDEKGCYYYFEDDVAIKKTVKRSASRVVLIADRDKFQSYAPCRMDFSQIDELLTDGKPNEDICRALRETGVRLTVVPPEKED